MDTFLGRALTDVATGLPNIPYFRIIQNWEERRARRRKTQVRVVRLAVTGAGADFVHGRVLVVVRVAADRAGVRALVERARGLRLVRRAARRGIRADPCIVQVTEHAAEARRQRPLEIDLPSLLDRHRPEEVHGLVDRL